MPDLVTEQLGIVSVWLGNGDGAGDVLTSHGVLFGAGDGSLGPLQPGGGWGWVVDDLNRDGVPDLLYPGLHDRTVSVSFGSRDGTFGPGYEFATGGEPLRALAVADVDSDGVLDIVAASQPPGLAGAHPGEVWVFLGR